MHTRRSFIAALSAAGCTASLTESHARALTTLSILRIGVLISSGYGPMLAAFKEQLASHGFRDDNNIRLHVREWDSNKEDVAQAAKDLTRAGIHLVVAGALPQALAIRAANASIPMVVVTCPGMVSNGFAQSLERPGGNVTGMDELPPGVTAKRLTLLKAAAPAVSRVALLSTTPGRGGHEIQLADAQMTAAALGIQVKPYRATTVDELKHALRALAADGMNGLANFQGRLSLANRRLIVDFAARHRLPAVYQATLFADAGGLMAWAPDLVDQYRTAADYVAKILAGARAGDLPISYPHPYYLTINARAARHLGLRLAPGLLAQAHRIIA